MISTHILDTSKGQPAANVEVVLELLAGSTWKHLESQSTNVDGRIVYKSATEKGRYRLNFKTESYLHQTTGSSFFGDPTVEFQIGDISRKYHIPLLLNPFGYSTYRGS